MQVIEHGEWSRWKIPVARTARVVSQNVGPLGLRHVIPIIQKMIMTQRPSVIFLQDCKLKETDANSIANLRQAFPSTVYETKVDLIQVIESWVRMNNARCALHLRKFMRKRYQSSRPAPRAGVEATAEHGG
jgi:hypothetical protein